MTIAHSLPARNAAADAVVDLLDAGTANAQGQLVLETSGAVEVATLPLSNPAFAAAGTGAAVANAVTADSSATGGVVSQFKLQDRDGTTVISGTVTATGGGGDIELTNTTIPVGGTVTINSMTYTAAA